MKILLLFLLFCLFMGLFYFLYRIFWLRDLTLDYNEDYYTDVNDTLPPALQPSVMLHHLNQESKGKLEDQDSLPFDNSVERATVKK